LEIFEYMKTRGGEFDEEKGEKERMKRRRMRRCITSTRKEQQREMRKYMHEPCLKHLIEKVSALNSSIDEETITLEECKETQLR